MLAPETRLKIEHELRAAETARAEGNEGRARVCARRAVGAALGDALRRMGAADLPPGAMDLLRQSERVPGLSQGSRQALERMTRKVDEGFNLPAGWDLIADARAVIAELEPME